ncbi:uncharacterized protein An02g06520 [Aspergillus niger]|uniref:Contig An02c0190, genomic contig n=2 Tax=Aspergillus niger TaxID=5061 RepID=A2QDB8_ASPNC|nr:uncharacterized protein An02g06520 [Aspergillus niger]CAL00650.1 unnamed protein product [Aspergillus niger]
MAGGFLPYHEPGIVNILILISFFFFLSLAEWISSKIIRAGIIGQIAVGIIYGTPLANILHADWQSTFLALGYIGLILIIFEGGLGARLDLLKKNFFLSMIGAATGVLFPIGLSYLLLYLGFGYGAVETFIVGASLSATSLGTTFAVISTASSTVDLAQTRVGSILVSAAVIDDVVGLVMLSVINDLGELGQGHSVNLGWLIGRPIVASIGMAIVTPLVTKFLFAPLFRRYIEYHFARFDHISNIILMILVLCAFISIAAYTGTSILFGAFLAGEREENKSPTFVHTFERYLLDVQKYLMEPLFFSSIGFAIPFVQLWTGKRIWRGIVFTLLMLFAKLIVGIWSTKPVWSTVCLSGLLLGSAMVARGEIGLLIVEVGYNETSYVSEDAFITAVWAILLNTVLGPVTVGLLMKFHGKEIGEGAWGLQGTAPAAGDDSSIDPSLG